jgi:hypothetical protein
MKPRFGQVVFGSLAPLFGAGLQLRSAELGNEVAYAGAALSLVGASYMAIASFRDARGRIEPRSLTSIAHARRALSFEPPAVARR